MQSPLFIFIGLAEDDSDASIELLKYRLDRKYEENEIHIQFTRKDELLSADFDDVTFHISFLKNKNELKDWFQLAIDFELQLEDEPITKTQLFDRYLELTASSFQLYKQIHYKIGLSIMDEMEKFSNLKIYSFQ